MKEYQDIFKIYQDIFKQKTNTSQKHHMFIECIRNRTESTESLGTLRFYLEEKQPNICDHSRTKYQV